MGEKMGGLEILATAKRGALKFERDRVLNKKQQDILVY